MDDDACGEMMPRNKEIGLSERQESTRGDQTYREVFSENNVPRKNILRDESTVGFKYKNIFLTYNKKYNELGHEIICIS